MRFPRLVSTTWCEVIFVQASAIPLDGLLGVMVGIFLGYVVLL